MDHSCVKLRVDELLGIQLVQPVQTIAVALLGGGTDDFPVVGNGDMAVLVSVAVAFAKAIDEDAGVLIARC